MSKELTKNLLKEKELLLFARSEPLSGQLDGYVVIAVISAPDEAGDVISKVTNGDFYGTKSKTGYDLGEWYGGSFDYIAGFEATGDFSPPYKKGSGFSRFMSYGDNRFFGYYTAEEVLEK